MSDGREAGERRRTVTWSDPKALAAAGRGLSGAAHLRAMMAGDLPPPPVMALLGITLDTVDEGLVRMQLQAAEYLYNPIGTVHGGIVATILDSVMGCAVHSTLPVGRGYTTLEIKVNYLRAVTEAAGIVTAEGRAVHVGRTTGVADARLFDAAGRLYATASTTCLVFDLPPAKAGA
ncbi:PaaI family thioesterase [Enterovirga sp. CN4-39]|uniref:PaaI family thioesterase n=1 Tax=Enterovirga sp. CN4-39 TaxID=3400910 RepID=UPI003BFAD46B